MRHSKMAGAIDAKAIDWASEAIGQADFVLIGAGAGLSAAAGLDYGDEDNFRTVFPAFYRKGFQARYQAIGYFGWQPEEFWGYWATHVLDARFGPRHDQVYRDLLTLVADKDHFAFTSNVDRFFDRNGLDAQRLYTPQGDYGYLQCRAACRPVVWESEEILETIAGNLDPETQRLTRSDLVPRCPHCGGDVFLNVRIDRNFVETAYAEQAGRINKWLKSTLDGRLFVIEIGAGFNTPSVIRLPCEGLVDRHPDAKLLRINRDHPDVPQKLGNRAVGMGAPADDVCRLLVENLDL